MANNSTAISPPPFTPVDSIRDTIHGVEIADPYRWLEDQNSERTRRWIDQQTEYARSYFDQILIPPQITSRVAELISPDKVSDVWCASDRYFFLKRALEAEQPAIVMRRGCFGDDSVLVDPATRGCDAFTSTGIIAVSDDGRYLAYSVRHGGTDHSSLEILNVETRRVIDNGLPEGFLNGFVFAPNGTGFYYSHRKLEGSSGQRRAICFHRFGQDPGSDEELFNAGADPDNALSLLFSKRADLLLAVLFHQGPRPRISLYLCSPTKAYSPRLLLGDLQSVFTPFIAEGRLLACTDINSPNRRIVEIDPLNPGPERWREVVPESDRCIQQFVSCGGQIFVTRVERFSTFVEGFGLDGSCNKESIFSRHGTIRLLNRTSGGDKLFLAFSSICTPPTVYCLDIKSGQIRTWLSAPIKFNPECFSVKEASVVSKDGAKIPVLLAGKKKVLRSRAVPTFLTAYGGFGNCVTPRFAAFSAFLLERGFLFVIAAVRGGAELGEQWHQAGCREHRQKSFDDFIQTAEWLITSQRCTPTCLAIGGGSNAGLLMGAAITQRPELFKAAICLGPLLDMIRFHLFDQAKNWVDEYGSPSDPIDFRHLLAYSPYHQVRDAVSYPAVMMISGDADTRCNPMHARKMAARLQAANVSPNPILLDYRPEWGHMPVQPRSQKIKALTNRLAFVCRQLEVEFQCEGKR